MAKEKLTESESRYLSIIGRLGGTATVRQVADMLGVVRKLERVREELLSMSVCGLISMDKGAGGVYTVSLTTRKAYREENAAVAKIRTFVNASSNDAYDGADLRPIPGMNPSRLVAFSLPSRVGNRLYHCDGRVEAISQSEFDDANN
jgi:hypothetical protein